MFLLAFSLLAVDPNVVLGQQDETLARVGYRLATQAAPLCDGSGRPAGLIIERASLYPKSVRDHVLAGILPTVTVVVPGSPAAAAGLGVGDQITSIAGVTINPEDVAGKAMSYAPTAAVKDQLDSALAQGSAELSVISGGKPRAVQLIVPRGCAAEFLVRPGNKLNSYSDGKILQITSAVMAFCKTDAELAAVVAHELAHNILHHPQRLRTVARSRAAVRRTEVEAERLSFYLVALAGYSLDEAFALRDRLSRKTDWGIFGDGTHPGREEMLALLGTEWARIDGLRARGEPITPPADLSVGSAP